MVARTFAPCALYSRRRIGWDDVVAVKATKMVQAHDIHEFQDGAQPCNPPRIARVSHDVPAVHRVSPPLSSRTKIVWRDPRDLRGLARVIQGEQGRLPPDISAVVGHIDGEITDQMNVTVMAVLLQRLPLPKKLPLQKFVSRHGHWIRSGAMRPLRPREPSIDLFECHKPGKSLKPGVPFGTKRFECETIGPRERLHTPGGSLPQQGLLPWDDRFVIHSSVWKDRDIVECFWGEPSFRHQGIQAEQEGVPSHAGRPLIGGVDFIRWSQRQHLPILLTARCQKIDELLRRGPQVPNPIASWQGGGMEQETASALAWWPYHVMHTWRVLPARNDGALILIRERTVTPG